MTHHRWQPFLVALLALAVATPAAFAQQSAAGVTVERSVTTDAMGNTVITERTIRNGVVVKEEEKVLAPGGQLISKTEREFRLINGVLTEVQREVDVLTMVNGQLVRIKQEFVLQNGTLTLVEDESKVVSGGPGSSMQAAENEDEDEDRNKNENENENEMEHEHQGGEGNDSGHH